MCVFIYENFCVNPVLLSLLKLKRNMPSPFPPTLSLPTPLSFPLPFPPFLFLPSFPPIFSFPFSFFLSFSSSSLGKIIDRLTDLGQAGRGCSTSCRLARRRRGRFCLPSSQGAQLVAPYTGGWPWEPAIPSKGPQDPIDYRVLSCLAPWYSNLPHPIYLCLFPAFCSAPMALLVSIFLILLSICSSFPPPSKTKRDHRISPLKLY